MPSRRHRRKPAHNRRHNPSAVVSRTGRRASHKLSLSVVAALNNAVAATNSAAVASLRVAVVANGVHAGHGKRSKCAIEKGPILLRGWPFRCF